MKLQSLFVSALKEIRHSITYLMRCYCKRIPVDGRILLFEGKPDYSDNPRALCDFLIDSGYTETYQIYFLVKKQKGQYSNQQIHFLQSKNLLGLIPFKTMRVLYSAAYTFASHSFSQKSEDFKEGQKHVLLWHGCGYKDKTTNDESTAFDMALVPGDLFVKSKCKFWGTTPEKILSKGYPRYDWLLSESKRAEHYIRAIKEQYEVDKIIIWMPTFRNSRVKGHYREGNLQQFSIIPSSHFWSELDEKCRRDKVLLVVKLHISQLPVGVDFSAMRNIKKVTNDDIEENGCNLYEFLRYTDALITDYSSVAIDYLLVNRPIAFVLDDYEQYKATRGFIFENPKEFMPGHHVYDFGGLAEFIDDVAYGKDTYADQRKKVLRQAIFSSDCYCKDIVDELRYNFLLP